MPTDRDLREVADDPDPATRQVAPDDDTGPLTRAVRGVRKRLAKRRAQKRRRELERRKRRQESDIRQAAGELRELGAETGATDAARRAGATVRAGVDAAADEFAAVEPQGRGRQTAVADVDRDGFAEVVRVPAPAADAPQPRPPDRNPAVNTFLDERQADDTRAERSFDRRVLGPFDVF